MAIVKMKRFRLIALKQDRATLLSRMQKLGCAEISDAESKLAEAQWSNLLHRDHSSSGDVKNQISTVTNALEALKKYAPVKSGLFHVRTPMAESVFFDSETLNSALAVAGEIKTSYGEISSLNNRENRLSGMKASLLPWTALTHPLNKLSTPHVRITLGVCPAVVETPAMEGALAEVAPLSSLMVLSSDKDQHYLLLLCHESEIAAAEVALKNFAFSTTQFKELSGSATEEIARMDEELAEIAKLRSEAEASIAAHGDNRPKLQYCLDRLQQDVDREMAREHILTDYTIFFLEAWVSADGEASLAAELEKYSCAYSFEEATKEDTPPTLLKNPKWMSCINMVTEMYSLPKYHGGIDPNPLIFGFFILFFGFMFADIGYGIILMIACSFITAKYRPKDTMGYMFNLGIYLGASTFVFGLITGGFFGDALEVFSETFLGMETGITLPYLLSPLDDPMTVLIVAIGLGIVQLLFGQCVHIYMRARDGELLDGLLDVVPWWCLFAGIVLFAISGATYGLLAGAIILVLTQGRHKNGIFGKLFGGVASLYDITSWLSDVLSYCRLMALMLATSVIASVMNILGALPGSIVAFAVVFVIGHVFNIGVNIIGTYVHAARLQYLEFFGKFYTDGGIPFRPLKYRTKFIDITEEDS